MQTDERYMAEALVLAEQGLGHVEPNPPVGAVVVREGAILGSGWHRHFGGAHAEIEAFADARSAGADLAGATLYVTLEPCCHHGKTPPCTDAVIAAGIRRVVAAVEDPFPAVAGRGFSQLRDAGIEVVTGVLAEQARRLMSAYIKLRTTRRPWVICKWAQTLDGRIATSTGHSKWISSEASRQRVHEVRGICDAIIVGAGTVLADDPLLTNRSGAGRQPARVILDDRLEIAPDSQIIRSAEEAPVIIATTEQALTEQGERAVALAHAGAELLALPTDEAGVSLPRLLEELGSREFTRVLVEGGCSVLSSFLRLQLADELMVFLAPLLLGSREGLSAVDWGRPETISQAMRLPAPEVESIDGDLLLRYRLE